MKQRFGLIAGMLALLCLAFVAGRYTGSPGPASKGPDSKAATRRVLYYVDPMHPSYHSDRPGIAPDCGMALEPVYEGETTPHPESPLQPGGVTLSAERQQLIGIRVAAATTSTGLRTIRTTGRIVPDDNRLFRIQAGFDGWVDSLADTPPGTVVKADQKLATLYGPEIRSAELNFVAFVNGIERVKQAQPDADQKQVLASRQVSEEQLRLLGMGDKEVNELATTHHVNNSLDLVAPADGVVLSRTISPHQRFEKGAELYRIADLRTVWIVADVHGNEGEFKPGMHAKVRVPELGKIFDATVSSTVPLFDETSRTLKVRLVAENPRLELRPEMFVDVEFETKVPPGLSVPADAVLDSGLRKVVYVESSDGVFEPRPVEVAGVFGDQAILSGGIHEGERVVVSGNFLLDSESRMRSSGSPSDATMQPVAESHPELAGAPSASEVRDPVCGMTLKPSEMAAHENYQGRTYTFCSDSCRRKFLADPAKYTGKKSEVAAIRSGEAAQRHD